MMDRARAVLSIIAILHSICISRGSGDAYRDLGGLRKPTFRRARSLASGPTPGELGRQHGIPSDLHALIYSGGEDAPLSPLGCRTLSYAYACLGPGPFCNSEWCKSSPENQQKCNSLVQAGLSSETNLMEKESTTLAVTDTTRGFKNLEENEGVRTVMGFLCEPTTAPWWPADPLVGPSSPRISDGPVSKLAHDLKGKTMLMIGDSVMEQTCGALVCAMRRDASLGARPSPRIPEFRKAADDSLTGSAAASWEAEDTGFTLLCWRMDQYNIATLNSEERYRRVLAAAQPDVLVINHGHHAAGDMEAYTKNMQHLFALVQQLGLGHPGAGDKVFLWSTTAAQHFDTPTGDFHMTTQHQQQQSCYCADAKKGASTRPELQAREMEQLSKKFGLGAPLEMFELTSGRYDLHLEECGNFMLRNPRSPDCGARLDRKICDCTHFCYSPAFFDSIAEHLRGKLSGGPGAEVAHRGGPSIEAVSPTGLEPEARVDIKRVDPLPQQPPLSQQFPTRDPRIPAMVAPWGLLQPPYTMQNLKMGTRRVFPGRSKQPSASKRAWRSLADKITAGHGVTIHGIGSSVLGNHGGCSEPLPVLKGLCGSCCTLMGSPPPLVMNTEAQREYFEASGVTAHEGAGWARIALDWLNHTWPSSEHRLLNAARAGGGASEFATCLTKNTPMLLEADLVLLEFGVTAAQYHSPTNLMEVESIIRQLMALKRRPALMMVQFVEWCRGRGTMELCAERNAESRPVSIASLLEHTVPSDTEFIKLAQHYDIPLVSTVDFLWPEIFPNVSLAYARTGKSPPEEQMARPPLQLRRDFTDGTHPSIEGTRTFGALVSYGLHLALHESLHHYKGPHRPGNITTIRSSPVPTPLLTKQARLGGSECWRFVQSLGRSNFSAIPDHELPQILAQWPPVVSSEGFDYVDVITNRDGKPRWKPGVVATIPGSYVELGLDLFGAWADSKEHQHSGEHKTAFELELVYLQSFERMGQAAVTCSGGCSCGHEVIDAHTTATGSSVTAGRTVELFTTTGAVDAAQGVMCAVRIEVLTATRSGEHKFKLTAVTLRRR